MTAWEEAVRIAQSTLDDQGEDPTHGALFYHATYVEPVWAKRMTKTRKIGRHIFFKDPAMTADKDKATTPKTPAQRAELGERIIASLF